MSRKNYIYNQKPVFKIPNNNKEKKSQFVYYAMKQAVKIDVARNHLHNTLLPIDPKTGDIVPRLRRLNKHRACAMRAMVVAMIYHFDISSNLVQASIEQLSDECGLSTFSKSGNKSITRASRLISKFMEPMGFIKCQKILNKSFKHVISKKIFLTPTFFMLLNISQSKINQYLSKPKKILQCSKNKAEKSVITFEEIPIISQLDEKSIRNKILNILINYYTARELTKIGPKGLKKKIDIEYNNLCKLYKKTK